MKYLTIILLITASVSLSADEYGYLSKSELEIKEGQAIEFLGGEIGSYLHVTLPSGYEFEVTAKYLGFSNSTSQYTVGSVAKNIFVGPIKLSTDCDYIAYRLLSINE